MHRVTFVATFAIASMLAGAAPAAAQLPGGDRGSISGQLATYHARVQEEARRTAAEIERAWNGDDARALAALYVKDAVLVLRDGTVIRTQAAIARTFAERLPKLGRISFTVDDFDTSGDVAFISGTVTYECPQPAGGIAQYSGSYSMLLRRVWIGTWHVESETLGVDLNTPT